MLLKLFFVFMALLIASSLQSCAQVDVAQVDVKRITYKALRQHDCRINEPNAFCERGFSNEYDQYERMRQQYLHDTKEPEQRYTLTKTSFKLDDSDYYQ